LLIDPVIEQVFTRTDATRSVPALPCEWLATFEDFCIVTQSVRAGIPADVTVEPAAPGA